MNESSSGKFARDRDLRNDNIKRLTKELRKAQLDMFRALLVVIAGIAGLVYSLAYLS